MIINCRNFVLLLLLAILVFLPRPDHDKAMSEKTGYSPIISNIDALLKKEQLVGAVTGISIREAKTGKLIYSANGDIRLHPASNMKLLTGAAAMETLGAEYQFSTELKTDGKVRGHTLQGNLYLKGKGDPTLIPADLVRFAKDLKLKGIECIEGDLIGDDNWYDDVRLSQDLNWSDEFNYTGAQVSALTLSPDTDFDTSTVIIEVSPASKTGMSGEVKVTPANDYVEVINKAITVEKEGQQEISVNRIHGTNKIVVNGTIPLGGGNVKSWIAVWEPTAYVLNVFKSVLEENGVKFNSDSKMMTGETPNNAWTITSKKSIPLKELFVPYMKLSNNGISEMLTKEMGRVVHGKGSWERGLQVIAETLSGFGVNIKTILLRDGSGMSHKNLIPPNELSQLLFGIQKKEWFPDYEHSLPIAGESNRLVGGTLRTRMTSGSTKGNVKAKTGLIYGVSTISGYVTSKNGEKLIFSIMINNYLSTSVTSIEDEIIKVLAEFE